MAVQLMAEAENKLTQQKRFRGSLFCGSSRLDDAVDCYQRARNLFKIIKNWTNAGECFCEVANLHGRFGGRHDAGLHHVEALNCYKKGVSLWQQSIIKALLRCMRAILILWSGL